MYQDHPAFEEPSDENATIWRYIDFTKLASLLDKRALFFVRLDRLGDPFEGFYSKANVEQAPAVYGSQLAGDQLQTLLTGLGQVRRWTKEVMRKRTAVSCWHLNDFESDAMWKLYLRSGDGIAIQSTFRRLADSFSQYTDHTVYIGLVQYADYGTAYIPESNAMSVFMHKRIAFAHEHELRALICEFPTDASNPSPDFPDPGFYVPIQVETLINRIFVAPTSQPWFTDLVTNVVAKYGLNVPIVKSDLAGEPPY
jgi:hypothetical protein